MTAHFYTAILRSAETVTGCCLPSLQDPEANPFHPQDTNSGRRLRSTKTKKLHTLQLASSTRPLTASPRWLMAQLMLSVSHWRRKKCLCLAAYTRIPSCLHWKLFHNPPPTQLILLKFCLDLITVIPVHTAARSVLCYMGFLLHFIIQPTIYRITSLDLGGNFTKLTV